MDESQLAQLTAQGLPVKVMQNFHCQNPIHRENGLVEAQFLMFSPFFWVHDKIQDINLYREVGRSCGARGLPEQARDDDYGHYARLEWLLVRSI